MRLVKVETLTGKELDWAVAVCEGTLGYYVQPNAKRGATKWKVVPSTRRYSTNWAQGGPIVEREWIDLHCVNDSLWEAECPATGGLALQNGPTPLVAAMRCYCYSKVGDEIEIPEEL